jgi:hypothetical protein
VRRLGREDREDEWPDLAPADHAAAAPPATERPEAVAGSVRAAAGIAAVAPPVAMVVCFVLEHCVSCLDVTRDIAQRHDISR